MRVPSPVTGGPTTLWGKIDSGPLIERYRADLGLEVADYLKGRERLDIYECQDTGFRFFARELAGEAAFYDQLWKRENPNSHRPTEGRDDWNFALDQIRPGERVLDVGAAGGEFVARAAEIADAEGIDESAEGCRVARDKGLNVHCTSATDFAAANPGAFDKVIASQVLEHVYDVAGFVTALKDLLKPGGKMILAVPNNEPYYVGWAKYDPLNNPPHHIGHWNEASLRKMAEHFGLTVEQVAYLGSPDRFTLQVYRRAAYLAKIPRAPRRLTKDDWTKLTAAAPVAFILTVGRRMVETTYAYGYVSIVLRKAPLGD